MKNLAQIRSANALAYAKSGVKTRGTEGGDVVNKLPALIMSNGLLAAGAFAYRKGEGEGWYVCFDHLAMHLADTEIGILPANCTNLRSLLDHLSITADSSTLMAATDEALAWLGYARRYVPKERQKGGQGDSH